MPTYPSLLALRGRTPQKATAAPLTASRKISTAPPAAMRGEGLAQLQERLATFFDRALRPMRLLFPYAAAGEMHRLRGVASDVHEEHTADGVIFEARLPVSEAGRYARYRTDVREPDDPEGSTEVAGPQAADGDSAEADLDSEDVR